MREQLMKTDTAQDKGSVNLSPQIKKTKTKGRKALELAPTL